MLVKTEELASGVGISGVGLVEEFAQFVEVGLGALQLGEGADLPLGDERGERDGHGLLWQK